MTGNRQQRVAVLHEVAQGQLTAATAAPVLGVSERQVWRLLAADRREGAAALQHGNTGRRPAQTSSAAVRQRVVTLAATTDQGCHEQHLSALLAEREGIVLARSRLRRILRAAGLGAARPLPACGDARADRCQSAGYPLGVAGGARATPDAGGGDRCCHQRGAGGALPLHGGRPRLVPPGGTPGDHPRVPTRPLPRPPGQLPAQPPATVARGSAGGRAARPDPVRPPAG